MEQPIAPSIIGPIGHPIRVEASEKLIVLFRTEPVGQDDSNGADDPAADVDLHELGAEVSVSFYKQLLPGRDIDFSDADHILHKEAEALGLADLLEQLRILGLPPLCRCSSCLA